MRVMADVTLPQVPVAAVILLPKFVNMFRRLGNASFRFECVRVDTTSRCGIDLVLQERAQPPSANWVRGGALG